MRTSAIALCAALCLGSTPAPAFASLTLQETGERGYLGVQITADEGRVEVLSVVQGSAAESGGLQAGDVVLSVGGQAIDTFETLGRVIASHAPGDVLEVKVRRDGAERALSITLGRRPAPGDEVRPTPKPGVVLPKPMSTRPGQPRGPVNADPTPPPARGWLGVFVEPADSGLRIDETVADGPAAAAGLQAGDVILSVEGEKIGGTDALSAVLGRAGAGQEVDVTVMRDGTPLEFTVTLRAHPDDPAGAAASRPAPPRAPVTQEKPPMNAKPAPADRSRPRAWLGVTIGDADRGVRVDDTIEDGPAARGGLEAGDVIVSVGGAAVTDLESLRAALASAGAGKKVAVTVLRGETPREFDVVLGTSPESSVAVEPLRPVPPRRAERTPRAPGAPPAPKTPSVPAPSEETARTGGYLGVLIAADPQGRALVTDVRPGGPAAKGKLAAGDVVVAVDGKDVESAEQLRERLAKVPAGTEVEVTVDRDGEQHHRIVRLAAFDELEWGEGVPMPPSPPTGLFPRRATPPAAPSAPTPPARPAERGYLGVSIEDGGDGARVLEVHDDTAAARAGLREGDVITRVGSHRVRSTEELLDAMEQYGEGASVELRVERGDQVIEHVVTLGPRPNLAAAEPAPAPRAEPTPPRRAAERTARLAKREAAAGEVRARRAARPNPAVAERPEERARFTLRTSPPRVVTGRSQVIELDSEHGPSTILVLDPEDASWRETLGDGHDVIIIRTKTKQSTEPRHCCCCRCGEAKPDAD